MEQADILDRLLHIERVVVAMDRKIDRLLELVAAQSDMRALEALVVELRALARVVGDVGR